MKCSTHTTSYHITTVLVPTGQSDHQVARGVVYAWVVATGPRVRPTPDPLSTRVTGNANPGPMLRSPKRFISTTSSFITTTTLRRASLLPPSRNFSSTSKMSVIQYPKARRDEDHVEVYKSKKQGEVKVKDRK